MAHDKDTGKGKGRDTGKCKDKDTGEGKGRDTGITRRSWYRSWRTCWSFLRLRGLLLVVHLWVIQGKLLYGISPAICTCSVGCCMTKINCRRGVFGTRAPHCRCH
jgi:hypothetical protein